MLLWAITSGQLIAQLPGYWQQAVKYQMDVVLDVKTHQMKGKQRLTYTNHSPDSLDRVYYHLYFNAFQPGSMMDERARSLPDEGKIKTRIANLGKKEMGYHRILSLLQDGKETDYEVAGTILEVKLARAIAPGQSSLLEMKFESQVPLQIRRSGRDNHEGIAYTMSQWYPKLCEYDRDGWHADPYIGREFHGVWGDFDVKITLDSSYMIGGTGYLQNPQEIGHGYQAPGTAVKRPIGGQLTWHFIAPRVHDFAWAADPDYVHDRYQVPDGPELHFIYEPVDSLLANWKALQPVTAQLFNWVDKKYGAYPYRQFTVIQGGDGGMEYPMSTIITGNRSMKSLVSVTYHEAIHAWYYGLLATNEAMHPWMDEGFTCYVQYEMLDRLYAKNELNPWSSRYANYYSLAELDLKRPELRMQEPLSTHADHYETSFGYGVSAYSKGAVFLHQLSAVVGQEALEEGLKMYYDTWKYKHPEPRDFMRIMEKVSGLELDWYYNYWIHSTKVIDYEVVDVKKHKKGSRITLRRNAQMPMPLDVVVHMKDGTAAYAHIPLRIMRGAKEQDRFFFG